MVREARFSWDEDDPFRPLERPDRFDDLDDLDLDPLCPRPRMENHGVNRNRNRAHSAMSDDRRHLAGADWTNDLPEPNAEDD